MPQPFAGGPLSGMDPRVALTGWGQHPSASHCQPPLPQAFWGPFCLLSSPGVTAAVGLDGVIAFSCPQRKAPQTPPFTLAASLCSSCLHLPAARHHRPVPSGHQGLMSPQPGTVPRALGAGQVAWAPPCAAALADAGPQHRAPGTGRHRQRLGTSGTEV